MTDRINRHCGDCTLCCKLLAVNELGKLAGERCKHQRGTGCRVYHGPKMPMSCHMWRCQWLAASVPRELRRPDRSHYVIDIMPDFVTRLDEKTGETMDIPVVQVWCDPAYPDAHRDPAFRAWLESSRQCALIRYDSSRSIFLAPPTINADGTWFETEERTATLDAHRADEVFERVGARLRVEFAE